MSLKLRLLLRVITQRVQQGEALEEILDGYPKLLPEERQAVTDYFAG